jgi:hypothetical protein
MSDEILQPKRVSQGRFLRAFRQTGSITKAAEIAGISRSTHYDWLEDDKKYPDKFKAAVELAGTILEEKAFKLALEDEDRQVLMFLLKNLMPERYRDKQDLQHSGEVTVKRVIGVNIDDV